MKRRSTTLLGFAITSYFFINQPAVASGQGIEFPQSLAGPVIGNPSCVSSSGLAPSAFDPQMVCVAKSIESHLFSFEFVPGVDFANLPDIKPLGLGPPVPQKEVVILSNPSCAPAGQAKDVACAVVAPDFGLRGIRFSGTDSFDTGVFRDLRGATGPAVVGDPSCVQRGENLICAVRGMDSFLWGIRFNARNTNASSGFTSSGLRSLGGPMGDIIVGDPSCAGTGTEDLTCVVADTQGSLWAIRFNPQANNPSPLGFINLGKPPSDSGDIVPNLTEGRKWGCARAGTTVSTTMMEQEVTCVVRTSKNKLFGIRFDPRTAFNSGFIEIPQETPPKTRLLVGKPSCTLVPGNFVNCVLKGEKNRLFATIFDPRRPELIQPIFEVTGGLGPIVSDPGCATFVLPNPHTGRRMALCGVIDGANVLFVTPALE